MRFLQNDISTYKPWFVLQIYSNSETQIMTVCSIGQMYQYGHWVKRDIEQAEYWYLKTIESDEKMTKKVVETCLGKNHTNHN